MNVGEIQFQLSADMAQMQKTMKRAEHELRQYEQTTDRQLGKAENRWTRFGRNVGSSLNRMRKSMLSWQSAVGVASGAAGLGYLIQRTMQSTQELKHQANMAGTSVKTFQELSYAARQLGASESNTRDALKEFNMRIAEFARLGSGPAKDAYKALKISQKEAQGQLQNTDKAFMEMLGRLKELDAAKRMELADKIFGGQGAEAVISLIDEGTGAVRGMRKEAGRLGVTLDQDTIKKSNEAYQSLHTLTSQVRTAFTQAVAGLAPHLEDVTEDMSEWISDNQQFLKQDIPRHISDIAGGIEDIVDVYNDIPEDVRGGAGVLGAALLGKKAAMIVAAMELLPKLANTVKGFQAASEGKLDWMKFATMNAEELAKRLEKLDQQKQGGSDGAKGAQSSSDDAPTSSNYQYTPRDIWSLSAAYGRLNEQLSQGIVRSESMASAERLVAEAVHTGIITLDQAADTMNRLYKVMDQVEKQRRIEEGTTRWTDVKDLEMLQQVETGAKVGFQEMQEDASNFAEISENAVTGAFDGMSNALTDFVMTGKMQWEDLGSAILSTLTEIMIKIQMVQALKGMSGYFDLGWFSDNSQGNAFNNGQITPYASGGIVNQPTVFPMANGAGVMGEAGPEAVMPLTRTQDGGLGVQAQGNDAPNVEVNIINKTGEKTETKQEGPKWNGQQWVMNIVLDAVNRNKDGFGRNLKAGLSKA